MSYKTLEVELDHGRVKPRGVEALPTKAHALLTILETDGASAVAGNPEASGAGLRRFLSTRDFPLSPEKLRSSMEADFFEQ
jgi:hypothetical protein